MPSFHPHPFLVVVLSPIEVGLGTAALSVANLTSLLHPPSFLFLPSFLSNTTNISAAEQITHAHCIALSTAVRSLAGLDASFPSARMTVSSLRSGD